MKNNKLWLGVAIIFLGVSIMISSYIIGSAIISADMEKSSSGITTGPVLNLTQVAIYLNMSEKEVSGIIKTEKDMLNTMGSFTGIMFPYFIVDKQQYFYKDQIDEWLKEVSGSRKEYNTVEGWVF
jgi:hypothetical protein